MPPYHRYILNELREQRKRCDKAIQTICDTCRPIVNNSPDVIRVLDAYQIPIVKRHNIVMRAALRFIEQTALPSIPEV
jgi:hypothetical protein